MKKMILIFSHILSDLQKIDAKKKFKIDKFTYLPRELQDIWSNLPTDKKSIKKDLEDIKKFLKNNSSPNDLVLVQGDFGAVYQIVNFCKEKGLIPVYATTKREIEEIIENNKTIKKSIFKHRRFREYE